MKIVRILLVLLTISTALITLSTVSFAHDISDSNDALRSRAYSEYYISYTGKTTKEWSKNILASKLTIRKDTTIAENSTLYLKKGASLIIKNGAKLTVNGTLVIEQGTRLYITNGIVKINKICNNYGKIIIRKNGKLSVTGKYGSNGFSKIALEGNAYFGKASLKKVIKQIGKTDPNFKLSDCCINYFGSSDMLGVYYCIGNAVTDYCYTLSPSSDSKKLEAENFDPEKVYDDDLKRKIITAVRKYISDKKINETLIGDKYLFSVNVYFSYSFKTNTLNYEDTYFEFIYDDESPETNYGGVHDKFHEDTLII